MRPAGGCWTERSVGAVRVVVRGVLLQYRGEVARSSDQEVVEAFAAQRADEAFGDRVGPRRLDGGAEDADAGTGEHGVEGGGELGIAVADEEPELVGAAAEVDQQVAGLWVTQAPVGWAVIPARCTRRRPCSITSRM